MGDVVQAALLAQTIELGTGSKHRRAPKAHLDEDAQLCPIKSSAPGLRELLALGVGQVTLALGHDPARLTLEYIQLLHDRLDCGHDLSSGGAGPDYRYPLVGEIVLVFPAGRVEFRSCEVLQTRPFGVAGYVQESDGADEHVTLVGCP